MSAYTVSEKKILLESCNLIFLQTATNLEEMSDNDLKAIIKFAQIEQDERIEERIEAVYFAKELLKSSPPGQRSIDVGGLKE